MMDTENLNLSDAQRDRLYEMMEEKGKSFSDNQKEERVPDSQRDDRNPFEESKITTADQTPEEASAKTPAETEQTAEITFYVAECMEFPVLGEYHEDIGSLQEAMTLYEQIPAERMNGIKGIGFTLNDGSTYDGMSYELMSAGIVDRDLVEEIPYFKENPLLQNALAELEAVYRSPHHAEQTLESGEAGTVEAPAGSQRTQEVGYGNTEQINSEVGGGVATIFESHMGHADKAVTVSGRREDPAARSAGKRKESVLQALRERQAKIKGRETEKTAQKTQNRRKGEQEL
ncbi:MAG: hypothetical protein LUI14_10640 [Lachnospiraceae bacterium]|nr:hypothetical protein [Lachnospiraceae bacterium]